MSIGNILGIVCAVIGITFFVVALILFECGHDKLEKENEWLRNCYEESTKKYVDELKYKDFKIKLAHKKYNELYESYEMLKSGIPTRDIVKIIHNKKATIVWFKDGNKVIVKPAKGEKGDVYNAVAYATMKNIYGNNTQFKKYVDERVVKE